MIFRLTPQVMEILRERHELSLKELKDTSIKVQRFAFDCGRYSGTGVGVAFGFILGLVSAVILFYIFKGLV